MKCNSLLILLIITIFHSCTKEDENIIVTDIDGNIYHTITIGSQVWMAENLKVTRYNDGTEIPNISGKEEWSELTSGAYCNYNNDSSLVDNYGRLYNWHVINSGKICPKGWHIPSIEEWPTFDVVLGSTDGFPADPAGYCSQSGNFENLNNGGYWWTINDSESDKAYRISILFDNNTLNSSLTGANFGFSIRCIKDS